MRQRTRYTYKKDMTKELPPFDPTRTDYSETELELYADKMLREAGRDPECVVLFQEHIEQRWRTELLPEVGTPDAAISNSSSPDGQRMFGRQHPQGRKVNSAKQRKDNGASYYRAGGIAGLVSITLGLPTDITMLILSIELAVNLYGYFRKESS